MIGRAVAFVLCLAFGARFQIASAEIPDSGPVKTDFYALAADLIVPSIEASAPGPGKRVALTSPGWEGSEVHHLLYLPRDWQPAKKFPVLVEYGGNGGFHNALGDTSDGTVEATHLGYGLSGGEGFIWVSMPFVEVVNGGPRNAVKWWGEIEQTKRYCLATVEAVCERFGGDPSKVVLCGFSRGAIAANFLGLHDETIAKLWCAFFCHSHYDGARPQTWYPGGDRASALERLRRLDGRPQWISHELSVEQTESYLRASCPDGRFTFATLPFPNHTDSWVLRDLPLRTQARNWLRQAVR